MKKCYAVLTIAMFCMVSSSILGAAAAAVKPAEATTEACAELAVEEANAKWETMTRKEKRHERKRLKHEVKKAVQEWKASGADAETLLLVIIAILLLPLAMLLFLVIILGSK